MNKIVAATAACLVLMIASGAPASAETWTVRATLIKEKSRPTCPDAATNSTFTLEGGFLTLSTQFGKERMPVAADGAVKQQVRASYGAILMISGNANTKDLVVSNDREGCQYRYVVVK